MVYTYIQGTTTTVVYFPTFPQGEFGDKVDKEIKDTIAGKEK